MEAKVSWRLGCLAPKEDETDVQEEVGMQQISFERSVKTSANVNTILV